MKRTLIIMSANLPTVGHQFLLDFAQTLTEEREILTILVNELDGDPVPVQDRVQAIREFISVTNRIHNSPTLFQVQGMRSSDEETVSLEYWRDEIIRRFGVGSISKLVVSESWGLELAKMIGARFIPADIPRHMENISGTQVRQNIPNAKNVMKSFRVMKSLNVVVFGQESVGKTTTACLLGDYFKTQYVPEFARPFLEATDYPVDSQTMVDIMYGQGAYQIYKLENSESFINIFDTDLLSTYGYAKLMQNTGRDVDETILNQCVSVTRQLHATGEWLYLVLDDSIPFEEDKLRVGGDKRETDTKFWTDLLDDLGILNYKVIGPGTADERLSQCLEHIRDTPSYEKLMELKMWKRKY